MNYTIDTRLWTPVEMRSEQRVWLAYEMGRCGAGIDVMTALDQAVQARTAEVWLSTDGEGHVLIGSTTGRPAP